MTSHYKRWQVNKINESLKVRRVLLLSGSRQCGKTTLAKDIASPPHLYRTLDDILLLSAAQTDPHGFVKHEDNLMIIDEIQRAPLLLQAIKMDVDNNTKPGRFLLTGSANIESIPTAKESLAGRVRHIRLRPLAIGEIEGLTPAFLQRAFNNTFSQDITFNYLPRLSFKDLYISYALTGGYPEVLKFEKERDRRDWFEDYINAMIHRDLKDIMNIKRIDEMRQLITIMAGWSSRFIDFTRIGASLTLTRPTLTAYINALEALYLVERVPPWTKTAYDKVGKHDKLFMTDTGMIGALLGWTFEHVQFDGARNGMLLETFAFTQLAALLDCQAERYILSHYRDRENREIDFIVENEQGALVGIEVKPGSVVSNDDFKHLRWFKERMALDMPFTGIVLYSGNYCVPFGDGFWAIPLHALWQ
ncbi:MAG: ATP-binding protein [Pseudomonadota bacterium]